MDENGWKFVSLVVSKSPAAISHSGRGGSSVPEIAEKTKIDNRCRTEDDFIIE